MRERYTCLCLHAQYTYEYVRCVVLYVCETDDGRSAHAHTAHTVGAVLLSAMRAALHSHSQRSTQKKLLIQSSASSSHGHARLHSHTFRRAHKTRPPPSTSPSPPPVNVYMGRMYVRLKPQIIRTVLRVSAPCAVCAFLCVHIGEYCRMRAELHVRVHVRAII